MATIKILRTFAAISVSLCSLVISPLHATVTTYPAPAGEVLSTDYTVTADGQNVAVYRALGQTLYGGNYSFCSFDFSGTVTIVVTTSKSLANLVVLPPTFGIVPRVSGNTATMTLTQSRFFSFESSGITAPLLIFANPPEVNPPQNGAAGVVYRAAGVYTGDISLSAGQTLYLAGGSILKGCVNCNGNNITIRGRGLIDGNQWGHFGRSGFVFNFNGRRGIRIQDIIVRGAWAGVIWPQNNDSTTVTGLKICNSRFMNEDGISSYNSTNVLIDNCFVRSDDDNLPIKSRSQNITQRNCVLWCDRARVWCIGAESAAGYCQNVRISNMEVIHYGMAPFWFEPYNGLTQRDIRFDNIRLYGIGSGGEGQFDLHDVFHITTNSGTVTNVYWCNIVFDDPLGKLQVIGTASNLTFNHVVRNGVVLTSSSSAVTINAGASNIQFLNEAQCIPSTPVRYIPEPESRQQVSSAGFVVKRKGKLSITGIDLKSPFELSIIRPDGALVYSGTISSEAGNDIQLPLLAKGLFIVRLHSNAVTISKKVMME